MLRALPTNQTEGDDFRISLAGAQEKTALLQLHGKWMRAAGTTPTTHILKLPLGTGGGGIDLTTSVENEWLCMQILKAYGVPVPHCLTPRYDVLSAYPVLGASAGKLSPEKVKMAMAVEGKNRHYLWDSILYRHWEETARRTGLSAAFESLVQELTDSTSHVIDTVTALIPKGFPDAIATSILEDLRSASARLGAHTA